jgi:hypothetical protein
VKRRRGGQPKSFLVGTRFGRLTVVGEAEPAENGRSRSRSLVQCECGSDVFPVLNHSLRSGHTKSCGCLHLEAASTQIIEYRRTHETRGINSPSFKHGHTHYGGRPSPEYRAWAGMIQRCINPNVERYPIYGGAGVKVCGRWMNSFEAFFEDMGPRPKGMTLGRYLDTGNYEPGNCAWQTAAEQAAEKMAKTAIKAWRSRQSIQSATLRYWQQVEQPTEELAAA